MFKSIFVGKNCIAWSQQDDIHPLNCNISLAAVCVHDMTPDLVFPAPETDLRVVTSDQGHQVHVTRVHSGQGWQANYSLTAWHKDNNSRR